MSLLGLRENAHWAVLFLIVLSAFAVISSTHQCRSYYGQLRQLEVERWQLQEQYSRLLLEHSTLASPHRVARIAEQNLGMIKPSLSARRVVGS